MSLSLEMARSILASQPFSKLVGAEVSAFGTEMAELRISISDHLKQQNGFVHGGVIAYLTDNALAFAGGSVLGPAVVTSEFKINYVRPAMGEQALARAKVVYAGKSQAVCRCDVICVSEGRETVCALAQGSITLLGPGRKGDE